MTTRGDSLIRETLWGLLAGLVLVAVAALVWLGSGRADVFYDTAAGFALLAAVLSVTSGRVGAVAKIRSLSPYMHLPRSEVDVKAIGSAEEARWERRWHFFLIACLPCAVVSLVHFLR